MSMTRKHFKIIAEAIKNSTIETEEGFHIDQQALIQSLCLQFKNMNVLFRAVEFAEACEPKEDEYRRLKL